MMNTHNPFAAAYPSSRGPFGKIFWPVVNYRTYLRALHMLLMFPLGIAYFVFVVVSLAVGGAMIWTLVGPVVLVAMLFISRWLGDLEALAAGYVNGTVIRRPPSRLEGVSNFRSQVKVRLVDPTTWTGIVYLAVQGPVGVAAFVCLVVACTVSSALTFAPVIVAFTDEPLELVNLGGFDATFESSVEALQLTPFGILGFILASHVVLVFSSIHGWWARLMLGSRSRRVSGRHQSGPSGDDPSGAPADSPLDEPEVESSPILTLVPNPVEGRAEPAPGMAVIGELTNREREVFMLMARGDTNADIAELLFISEGTVKTHVKRIFSKLEVRDRAQLVVFAYEHGLVTPRSGEAVDVREGWG